MRHLLVALLLLPVVLGTEYTDVSVYVLRGTPVAGCNVSLYMVDTGFMCSSVSDSAGRAYFPAVPFGKYILRYDSLYDSPSFSVYIDRFSRFFAYDESRNRFFASFASASSVVIVDGLFPGTPVSIGPYSTVADSRGRAVFLNIPRGTYTALSAGAVGQVSTGLFGATFDVSGGSFSPPVGLSKVLFLVAAFVCLGVFFFLPGRNQMIDWSEFNWFGRGDLRFWRQWDSFDVLFVGTTLFATGVFFIWSLINLKEFFEVSLIYTIFAVWVGVAISLCVGARESASHIGAIVASSDGSGFVDKLRDSLLGLSIGFGLLFLSSCFFGVSVPTQVFPVLPFVLTNLLVVCILIPFMEECTFQGSMLSTISLLIGVVPAVLITSLAFGLFHWQIYGSVLSLIVMAVVFRLAISVAFLFRFSIYVGIAAHALYNTVVFLSSLH